MPSHLLKLALRLALAALALLAPARALGAEPPRPDAKVPERQWYGWQNLIVDASATLFTLPLVARNDTNEFLLFAFVGPPAYAVGAPIVHFAHDNVPKGLASLGLRLGAPPIVGGIASLGCNSGGRGPCFIGGAVGGIVLAMVLDDALLAYEDVPPATPKTGAALRLRPTFAADAHGAIAGVAGAM